ncbi:hypothetical protein HK099_006059 [Clydaea vesicula]|uniref:Uncharacterized protein n=1 Tax=Clydaea vesicula TaxID=447962 RepID=A0AAD5U650_9FUNG|nr:hypothetical protein HK099_006059 [Clydaea vesicula]
MLRLTQNTKLRSLKFVCQKYFSNSSCTLKLTEELPFQYGSQKKSNPIFKKSNEFSGNMPNSHAPNLDNPMRQFRDAALFKRNILKGAFESVLSFMAYDKDAGLFNHQLNATSPLKSLNLLDWHKLLLTVKFYQFRKPNLGTNQKVDEVCKRIMARMSDCGILPSVEVYSALAGIYAQCGRPDMVEHFSKISPRGLNFANSMRCKAYAIERDYKKCFEILDSLVKNIKVDEHEKLRQVLIQIIESLKPPNPYSKEVFEKVMPYIINLNLSYNHQLYDVLIQYHSDENNFDEMVRLMKEKSAAATFNIAMKAAINLNDLTLVLKFYFGMMTSKLKPNQFSWMLLGEALVQCGGSANLENHVEEAEGKVSSNLFKSILLGLFKLVEKAEISEKRKTNNLEQLNNLNNFNLTKQHLRLKRDVIEYDAKIYEAAENIMFLYRKYKENLELPSIDMLYFKIVLRYDFEKAKTFLLTLHTPTKRVTDANHYITDPLNAFNETKAYNDYITFLCEKNLYAEIYSAYETMKFRKIPLEQHTYDILLFALMKKYDEVLQPGDPVPNEMIRIVYSFVNSASHLGMIYKKRSQNLFFVLSSFGGTGKADYHVELTEQELKNMVENIKNKNIDDFVWPTIEEGVTVP